MDLLRDVALNFVRVTEVAALRASRKLGMADKNAADKAATDGMRGMLDMMDVRGTIINGEGVKDKAPMLFIGEKVGNWDDPANPELDISVDPIDGTRLVANGQANALAIIAAGAKGSMSFLPTFYVRKLSYGPRLIGCLDIDSSVRENLKIASIRLDKPIRDLTIAVLDRPRHHDLIAEIRQVGARIKLIGDGDVAASITTCMESDKIDLYMGVGGGPEAVITAAAMRGLGGDIQVKLYAKDEAERAAAEAAGYDMDRVYFAADLARGDDLIFACTGITDGELLPGIRYTGQKATSYSIVTRSKTRTVRYIQAQHDLKVKTIPSKEKSMEEIV